jgi:hypothetical protein
VIKILISYYSSLGVLFFSHKKQSLLHFVAFFHVASLLSIGVDNGKVGVDNGKVGVDNEKVGVDNEKALELDNRIFFFHIST